MPIARQGWRFIITGLTADAAGAALILAGVMLGRPGVLAAGVLLSALATVFSGFCLWFFRDPERPLPTDAKTLYSPGDGRVLSVARESGPGQTVRIFLSVFDVHVQRSPCAGRVAAVEYKPGSFRAAMVDEAKANERSIMTIEPDGREKVVVEQIAGYVARRIETWPKAGERVAAGQRYGIIYFGSQAAVHFPASARCTVKPGERVVAGVTPIGEWTS